jgi:hypothetical protein
VKWVIYDTLYRVTNRHELKSWERGEFKRRFYSRAKRIDQQPKPHISHNLSVVREIMSVQQRRANYILTNCSPGKVQKVEWIFHSVIRAKHPEEPQESLLICSMYKRHWMTSLIFLFKWQWTRYGLEVCDDGTLVQILCFWTLYIVLSLFKSRLVSLSKHSVSETRFCLRLQVKPTQFGPIDTAGPYLRTTESSLRNVVFWKRNGTIFWIQIRRCICTREQDVAKNVLL